MSILGAITFNNAVNEYNHTYEAMMAYCDSLYLYRTKSVEIMEKVCELLSGIPNKSGKIEDAIQSAIEKIQCFKEKEESAAKNTLDVCGMLHTMEYRERIFQTVNYAAYTSVVTTFGLDSTDKAVNFISERMWKRDLLTSRLMSAWFGGAAISVAIRNTHDLIDLGMGENYSLFALSGKIIFNVQKEFFFQAFLPGFPSRTVWWNDAMSFRAAGCLKRYKDSLEKCSDKIGKLVEKIQDIYDDLIRCYNRNSKYKGVDYSEMDYSDLSNINDMCGKLSALAESINVEV